MNEAQIDIQQFISDWSSSRFAANYDTPWALTTDAINATATAINQLDESYDCRNGVAVHASATVESGAIIKSPAIIGPHAFVAATAYLRGGVVLEEGCMVGPGCEVKSSVLFPSAKIAHLSFVGDSILGAHVNVEAGVVVANHRNELDDKQIRIAAGGRIIETGVDKFGALIGDEAKIGANAVIAPGAVISIRAKIGRGDVIDQWPIADI